MVAHGCVAFVSMSYFTSIENFQGCLGFVSIQRQRFRLERWTNLGLASLERFHMITTHSLVNRSALGAGESRLDPREQ